MPVPIMLVVVAFVLGICLHFALYQPTAMLPHMWRNLLRYISGVSLTMAIMAAALVLLPGTDKWEAFGFTCLLFGVTGAGVAIGYILGED